MKRHRSFELCSAKILEGMGYVNIDVTRGVADWGNTSGTGTCSANNSQTPELYKGNSKVH